MANIENKDMADSPKEGAPFPYALRLEARDEARRLLAGPRWRKLANEEIDREKEELGRTADELGIEYAALEKAFDAAELIELSDDDWSAMTNTDSGGEWTKAGVIEHIGANRDHAKIFDGLERGDELPAPVVLYRHGEPPYLIGGNTRLMACKATGTKPHVLAVRI